jgi:ABC-type branched-subunit amino acid transport system substrate-binding protein
MTASTRRPDSGRPLRIGAPLSLSGRYCRFGRQARLGLEIWRSWEGTAELIVEDDRSDPDTVESVLRRLATRCDILLGPYSTHLMRRAGDVAADLGLLLWNHGGSGDDVEAAHPGHVASVLTPSSRYAEPFLRYLVRTPAPSPLWIIHGRGDFGRQVAAGAAATARALGIDSVRFGPGDEPRPPAHWTLLCAASFEEDVATVRWARNLPTPPRAICAVAAGVWEFAEAVAEPSGIFGVGQWFPGGAGTVALGPTESEFLAAYQQRTGRLPDYPAVQAAATAAIATHCVRSAAATTCDAVWAIATAADTTTLFGRFAIDPSSGVQTGHEPVLVSWDASAPRRHGAQV